MVQMPGPTSGCRSTWATSSGSWSAPWAVPDASRVFVDVGLGFYAELGHAEALEWLRKKDAALNADAERLTARATQLRFQLRLGYELLGSLLGYQLNKPE
eukprot:EG_transcript_35395